MVENTGDRIDEFCPDWVDFFSYRDLDELGEKEDENEQQLVEEDTSINDESNAEQLTQLILCRNGRELRLLPTGDSETFTQGPLRAVLRSSRLGIRVFRPEE